MPPDPPIVGMHAYARVGMLSYGTIILLLSCSPPQLQILYETLTLVGLLIR